jgi:hypothetical protein
MLVDLKPERIKQIEEIDLNKYYKGSELIDILRGLTTNDIKESAYFITNGKKCFIKIDILLENQIG